ncbi:efflux RND transporter periplasmic adaptor subunit [Enterovibrio norvegicus]|uniref:efflux RND transporter periplasmic adaptor subunit n=1 Tax=Enterovibrio norvegicus TaxID=188144 RepID=UPI000C818A15|nr:efflux RND transporter periplasmic adaptor subunit [Enterovibrio norvegicus]
MMKRINQFAIKSLVPAIAIALVGCNEAPSATDKAPQNVDVLVIGDGQNDARLHFPAIAAAADRAELSFLVAGEINAINVKPGDIVKKGDVLASLDPTSYQLEVDNTQARFNVSDSQYRRSKPLVEKGLLAKSQFDELAAQRQIAKADLDLAKLKLSYTKMTAPVDGVISRVPTQAFENVSIGQTILNIHDASQVDVRIQVPDVLFARNGGKSREENTQHIRPKVQTDDGMEYRATVKEFTAQPDPETGSFMVTLTMPMPKDKFILDGMTVEVLVDEISLYDDRAQLIEVPIETVFNEDGDGLDKSNKFVWKLKDDNTLEKRKVTVGNLTPSGILIIEGVTSGDRIVSTGVNRLRADQLVNVIEKKDIDQ